MLKEDRWRPNKHKYVFYIGLSLDLLLKSYPQVVCTNTRTHFMNFIFIQTFTVHILVVQSTEQEWPVDWNWYTYINMHSFSRLNFLHSRLNLFLKILLHIFSWLNSLLSRLNLNLRICSEKAPSSSQELQPFSNGNGSISCLQPLTTNAPFY